VATSAVDLISTLAVVDKDKCNEHLVTAYSISAFSELIAESRNLKMDLSVLRKKIAI
jgi:hypothetical protein